MAAIVRARMIRSYLRSIAADAEATASDLHIITLADLTALQEVIDGLRDDLEALENLVTKEFNHVKT